MKDDTTAARRMTSADEEAKRMLVNAFSDVVLTDARAFQSMERIPLDPMQRAAHRAVAALVRRYDSNGEHRG